MLTPSSRQALARVFRPQVASLEPGLAEELTELILEMETEDIFKLLVAIFHRYISLSLTPPCIASTMTTLCEHKSANSRSKF